MPTAILYPTQATYLRAGTHSYDNYSSSNSLRCGNGIDTSTYSFSILIQFDLSSIAASAITSAKLYFYSYSDNAYRAGIAFFAYPCDQSWNASTAHYANMGTNYIYAYESGGVRQSGYDVWYNYDVTASVQAMVNGTISNYGFLLKQKSDVLEVAKCFYKFSGQPAYLEVVYTGTNRNLTLTAGDYIASTSGGGVKEANSSVTASAVLGSYTGYSTVFYRWYNPANGSYYTQNPYTFTMPNADLTLIAQATRTALSYSLSLVNGSTSYINYVSVTPNAATQTFGTSVTVSCALINPTGYTTSFYRWTSSNTSLLPSSATQTYTFSMPAGNLTLTATAIRTANTYFISYNANGGVGTMKAQTMTYDTASNLNNNTFTRVGYVFSGWAMSAGGAVVYTNQQSVINLSSTQSATVTLYAVWVLGEYTLTVQPNNADYGTAARVGSGVLNYQSSVNLTCSVTQLTGYTTVFQNWSSVSGGGFGNSLLNETTYSMPGNNAIVVANFIRTANVYIATFDYGVGTGSVTNKSVTFGGEYGELPTVNKNGYTFLGWSTIAQTDYTVREVETQYAVVASTILNTATNHTLYAWYHEDIRLWNYTEAVAGVNDATSRCLFQKTAYTTGIWVFSGNWDEGTQTYHL